MAFSAHPKTSLTSSQKPELLTMTGLGVTHSLSMGLGVLNLGFFYLPMQAEIGITRFEFGLAEFCRRLGGGLGAPFLGRMLDSNRLIEVCIVTMLTACGLVWLLGTIQSSVEFVVLFTLIGVAGFAGQGQLTTSVPLMKWFQDDRRDRMITTLAISVPLLALLYVPFTEWSIHHNGWRETWFLLATAVACLAIPTMLTSYPSRVSAAHPVHKKKPPIIIGIKKLKGSPFALLVCLFSLLAFAVSATAVHRIVAYADRGLPLNLIALGVVVDSAALVLGVWLFTKLRKAVSISSLVLFQILLLAVSTALTIFAFDIWLALLSLILFGLSLGGLMYVQNTIWPLCFGTADLGEIRGYANLPILILGSLGAPIAGVAHDTLGSYTQVWVGSLFLLALAAAISLKLRGFHLELSR